MSILVVGFFGEGNLGDEAVLEGLATSLPPGPAPMVTVGARPLAVPATPLPRRGIASWPAFLWAVRKSRHLAFTAGILQDWSADGVLFFALRMLAASLAGRQPALWGVGLGPLRHPAARTVAARVLRHAHPVWVRDPASARLYRELTGRTAALGCDWSWAIPDPGPEADRDGTGSRQVGLNLRPWSAGRFQERARRALAGRPRDQILGVAARAEDARLLRTAFPGLVIREPASFTELMRIGQRLEHGWAMRFHVVLAWLRCGIPVVPLAYDEKVVSLCSEVGVPTPWIGGGSSGIRGGHGDEQDVPLSVRAGFLTDSRKRLATMRTALQAWVSTAQG